jgi:hypothetical protein
VLTFSQSDCNGPMIGEDLLEPGKVFIIEPFETGCILMLGE